MTDQPKTHRPFIYLSVVALLAVGGFLTVMPLEKSSSDTQTVTAKPALVVNTVKPETLHWAIKLVAQGDISPWQEAIVGAEIDGLKLSAVNVNVGDVVHKNQVLAEFSKDTLSSELSQQNALVAEAEAVLAEAQANGDRARLLQKSGALPAQQINQLLIAERTANAKLNAAKAKRTTSQVRLTYTQILAPDDGVISARTATLGAVVSSGEELFRLIRKNRLEWRAKITAADIATIKIGGDVVLTLPNNEHINGRVRMIAPTVDTKTRDALVYVDINSSPQVKAGMFASGEFLLGVSDALTVPQQAVVIYDGFSYVFVVNKEQRVAQVKVHTGRHADNRIEILSGLSDKNADIVMTGVGFLNDGDLVNVQTANQGN